MILILCTINLTSMFLTTVLLYSGCNLWKLDFYMVLKFLAVKYLRK